MPNFVEARFKFVVGQSFLFKNLDACFESIGLEYEMVLGSLASAEAVLSQEEKIKGVVVADFGAETTSIIVFKNNMVRYAVVLPFGGNNINKDLLHLNMDQQEAERIKLEKGSAIHYNERDEAEDLPESYNTFDKEVNEVIVARIEEIIDNLYAQIRYAGIEPQRLTEGIVITGGASQLEGISTVITNKTGMKVRIGDPSLSIVVPEGMVVGPEDAQCIGLLLLGDKACLEANKSVVTPKETLVKEPVFDGFEAKKEKETKTIKKETITKPVKPKTNRFGSLINRMKGIFDEEDI
jgi:cell division protein FtsA